MPELKPPLYHGEVQLLDYGETRTSGSYLKMRFPEHDCLDPFRGLDVATKVKPGHILYITICEQDIAEVMAEDNEPPSHTTALYGQYARDLRLSGFFRAPKVWAAIDTDEAFLDWVRKQDCCIERCSFEQNIQAAHVRRVGEGAGMGIKPDYCAVPMCATHHAMQHQHGESAVGGREYLDKQRMIAIQTWGWQELKAQLGFAHWNEVPPNVLYKWAAQHGLANYLPACYVPVASEASA